jgi:hypothetical protein
MGVYDEIVGSIEVGTYGNISMVPQNNDSPPPRNRFRLFAVINPIALLHHSLLNDPTPRGGLAM